MLEELLGLSMQHGKVHFCETLQHQCTLLEDIWAGSQKRIRCGFGQYFNAATALGVDCGHNTYFDCKSRNTAIRVGRCQK